jgi:hypothetical protein
MGRSETRRLLSSSEAATQQSEPQYELETGSESAPRQSGVKETPPEQWAALKLGAGVGFEPTDLRGKGGVKAQWDAQNIADLLQIVSAWPSLRPELKAAIRAIIGAKQGKAAQ